MISTSLQKDLYAKQAISIFIEYLMATKEAIPFR